MIRSDTYYLDGSRRDYSKAHERKEQLRAAGWRVKIRKAADGTFEIFKKHVELLDTRNNATRGGHRKHWKKIPAWRLSA
jgi:hypothetical protein